MLLYLPRHCPSWEADGDPPSSSSHPCTHKRPPVLGVSSCRCTLEVVDHARAAFGVLHLHWGNSFGLPLPGGLDHCGRSSKTPIHLPTS